MSGAAAVVNLLNRQIPTGSTPEYSGTFLQNTYYPVPSMPSALSYLTLTIVDTLTGAIINNCQNANILNAGRGTVDTNGILKIVLEAGDTDMSDVPGASQVQRSLIIDYAFGGGLIVGSHRVDILIVSFSGPLGP